MKRIAVLCSVLLIVGCRSNKQLPFESCYIYDKVLKEFFSKFEIFETDCYVYNFEKDSTKYIDYNEFGGKTEFMDYRLNEILYYQHKLTNEFLDLPELSKKCLRKYSKDDIVKLFGKPTIVNDIYNYYIYYIVLNDDCNYCNGLEFSIGDCPSYVIFYFSDDGLSCNELSINIYPL